jgi:hypothetical protein
MKENPPYLRLLEQEEIGDISVVLSTDWKPKHDIKTLTLIGITMGILCGVVALSIVAMVIAWL